MSMFLSTGTWLSFVPCRSSSGLRRKTAFIVISGLVGFSWLLFTLNYGRHFVGTPTELIFGRSHLPRPRPKDVSMKDIKRCRSDKLHAGCMNDDDVFVLSPPSKDVRKFSVISASTPSKGSYNYVFYLPLTVRAWRRLGFGTLVILIGTLSEWTARPPLINILTELTRLKAAVVFVKGPQGSAVMLSQTCRLFAHNIFNTLSDDVNLITSDADLWPLKKDIYLPPKGVKVIRSTNSACCGHFKYRNMMVRMLPMSTVEMTVKVWKEVMNVNDSIPRTGQQILDYFVRTFGDKARGRAQPGNFVWYMDQKVISVRIKMWATRNGEEKVDYIRRIMRDRIDRSYWAVPRSLKSYNDAHLIHHAFQPEKWRKIRPLLKMMYNESEMLRCDEYFRVFNRLVRQAKILTSGIRRQ